MTAEEIATATDHLWGYDPNAIWNGSKWDLGGLSTYSHEERKQLAQAAIDAVPQFGVMLEIGVYGGLSLAALAHVARIKDAILFACDPFVWNPELAKMHLEQDVLPMFEDVDIRILEMTSETLSNKWSLNMPIHFLHIDGDHMDSEHDCKLWFPRLVSGGVVAFHDASPDPRNEAGYKIYQSVIKMTDGWPEIWRQEEANWMWIKRKP